MAQNWNSNLNFSHLFLIKIWLGWKLELELGCFIKLVFVPFFKSINLFFEHNYLLLSLDLLSCTVKCEFVGYGNLNHGWIFFLFFFFSFSLYFMILSFIFFHRHRNLSLCLIFIDGYCFEQLSKYWNGIIYIY